MRRIVEQHLGIWVLAGALFVGLSVASATPQHNGSDFANAKEQVYAPRAAQTIVQDPTGEFTGYRSSLAVGAM
ncbi:MAG: hypothetical protein ACMVY4_07460 [Minwuia sp.]|uniref:hypothetical protein n=1 Tax=Minwuia sp. TaxID=2493630 RepID=UPI003A8BC839